MNKLIIIGNGFDLAHGIPTSYNDFIIGYLKQATQRCIDKFEFSGENEIVNIVMTGKIDVSIQHFDSIKSFNRVIKDSRAEGYTTLTYKNGFFEKLIKEDEFKNWVDIEQYFTHLMCNHIDGKKPGWDNLHMESIQLLNKNLTQIENKLEEYLLQVMKEHNTTINQFHDVLYQPPEKEDFPANTTIGSSFGRTAFLNFNYTDTCRQYAKNLGHAIIDIHGQVNSKDNPIIFGMGDETNENFIKMREFDNNDLKHHAKSFKYHRRTNLRTLFKFIENDFQAVIIGHSCGLSDRFLLKQIFESGYCKSIKLIHYDNELNYLDTIQNISRHFNDTNEFMWKMVPYNEENKCPQYS